MCRPFGPTASSTSASISSCSTPSPTPTDSASSPSFAAPASSPSASRTDSGSPSMHSSPAATDPAVTVLMAGGSPVLVDFHSHSPPPPPDGTRGEDRRVKFYEPRDNLGGGEGFELLERGEQLCRPWPVVLEAQLAAAAVECEPTGDVQQPVAQPFGLGLGELAVEQQRLGPDDQIVREQHDLQPQLVERERLERELRQARVLVVADAVLDLGALAVAALDDRGVLVGLVGEDSLGSGSRRGR